MPATYHVQVRYLDTRNGSEENFIAQVITGSTAQALSAMVDLYGNWANHELISVGIHSVEEVK